MLLTSFLIAYSMQLEKMGRIEPGNEAKSVVTWHGYNHCVIALSERLTGSSQVIQLHICYRAAVKMWGGLSLGMRQSQPLGLIYTMKATIIVACNRMVVVTIKKKLTFPTEMTWYWWTDKHTRDCTEIPARNQPTEVVWLPPRKKTTSNMLAWHYFQITFRSGYKAWSEVWEWD